MNIVAKLRSLQIEVSVVDGKLKLRSPEGVMTDEVLAEIRNHKDYLIEYINATAENTHVSSIVKAAPQPYYNLSSEQKRLYFIHELDKQSLAYNLPQAVRLRGSVDKQQLQKAFLGLINRHDSLRTAFHLIDEEPVQQVLSEVDFDIDYMSATSAAVPELIKNYIRPFELNKAPLMRAGLIELATDEYILVVDMHHIITDGVSQEILIRDFKALYSNETLPPLPLQYTDYAQWQRSEAQQKAIAAQKAFWLNEFAGETTFPELPYDYPRPVVKTYAGDTLSFQIAGEQMRQLRSMAHAEETTLFTVVLSLYFLLISKLSNQEDIVIGIPVAGRKQAALDDIMGLFVNTLPLRSQVEGALAFTTFLANVKATCVRALDNQEYPYEELIQELKLERHTGHNPLFDIRFVYQNFEQPELEMSEVVLSSYEHKHAYAQFDITFYVIESKGSLNFHVNYSTALFAAGTIERFVRYFQNIMTAVLENRNQCIRDITVLNKNELHTLSTLFNNTAVQFPGGETYTQLFAQQVQATPDKIAVVFGPDELSYKALDDWSNSLALDIRKRSNGSGIVALYTPPSVEMIVGLLAILKAGHAFLPLDPGQQTDRQHQIVSESGCRLVLTVSQPAFETDSIQIGDYRHLPAGTAERIDISPQHLAYVIYTSGSTGKPKGVKIAHHNLCNYAQWAKRMLELTVEDNSLLTSSYAFDLGYTSIFPVLISGGSVHLVPSSVYRSPETLLQYIEDNDISYLKLTPSLFTTISDVIGGSGLALSRLRHIVLGGEPVKVSDIEKVKQTHPHIDFLNHYGPTETTIGVIAQKVSDWAEYKVRPTLGRPISNTRIFILDKYGRLVPPGVTGQLFVGGAGVGPGYLNDPQMTNEKFIDSPIETEGRLYATGDLGRWLANGTIEFLGRTDGQLKIRGYRVEPAEIEHHISQYQTIAKVYVTAKEKDGNRFLVAYYNAPLPVEAEKLKKHLATRLPDYMMPAYFMHLTEWPLTLNGKLDRKALPEPSTVSTSSYTAASNDMEEKLVEIWSTVLGLGNISVTDNFFAVGGDSIKSIQITARMRRAGYKIAVNDIFTHQTIRELASRVIAQTTPSDQSAVSGEVPLTPIQKRFFDSPQIDKHHYNQSVLLLFKNGITVTDTITVFSQLQQHHDALRMVFNMQQGAIQQINQEKSQPVSIQEHDLRATTNAVDKMISLCQDIQSGIDLKNGPLLKLGLFHLENGSRLLIVIHHLVIDGVSWRILLEDLHTLYQQITNRQPLALPPKTDSYKTWAAGMQAYINREPFAKAKQYWDKFADQNTGTLTPDHTHETGLCNDQTILSFSLDKDQTQDLLSRAHAPFNTRVPDLLLSALYVSIHRQFGLERILVDMEGHGREAIVCDADISRTVGWFTSIYPVALESDEKSLPALIRNIKEALRKTPNNGIDYLLWNDIRDKASASSLQTEILFNYWGQFDADITGKAFLLAEEPRGEEAPLHAGMRYHWELSSVITGGCLQMTLAFNTAQYRQETVAYFLDLYRNELVGIIDYCCTHPHTMLTPSDLTFKELTVTDLDELQRTYDLEDVYQLSPMQEGMLFHYLYDPDSENYFEQKTLSIKGSLRLSALQQSLHDLTSRYDILRTVFLPDLNQRPLQVVLKAGNIDFEYVDLRSECANGNKSELVRSWQKRDKARPFNLSADVLFRVILLHTADDEYEFIWSNHHILMDGWCIGLIWNAFRFFYKKHLNGDVAIHLPPARKYARYIEWLGNRPRERSAAYWKTYLTGYSNLATLPKKEGQIAERLTYSQDTRQLILDTTLTKSIQHVSIQSGVTVNSILQSAWALLLGLYNNTNDVVFGSVVSGRPADIEGIETMVGLFINAVPVRINWNDSQTIEDLLRAVQERAMESDPHHYNRLSEIQALSEPGLGLLDHIVVFDNYPMLGETGVAAEAEPSEYEVVGFEAFEQTNYDLAVVIVPGDTIEINFNYNANRFDAGLMECVAANYLHIIQQIAHHTAAKVTDVAWLSENESMSILKNFNDTDTAFAGHKLITGLFEERVMMAGGHTAILCEGLAYSYDWLNDTSNQLAHLLRLKGIGRGDSVMVVMQRRIELIVALFAILKAGGKYIPVEPYLPYNRIKTIASSVNAACILTIQQNSAMVLSLKKDSASVMFALNIEITKGAILTAYESNNDQWQDVDLSTIPAHNPAACNQSEDLAYVIFTSGSSGEPKGVAVQHKPVINLIEWMSRQYGIGEKDTLLLVSSISFDLSVYDIFGVLAAGGTVRIATETELEEPAILADILLREGITCWDSAPAMLQQVIPFLKDQPQLAAEKGALRLAFLSGDWIPLTMPSDMKTLFPNLRFIAMGGATEATVWSNYYEVTTVPGHWKSIPYGKPMQNARYLILDNKRRLCPIGVPGDLYIGGGCLAKGYINDEQLSQRKFISSPFYEGEMLYDTGDMARWFADGNIEFLGRKDTQVKIRGYRIELGEIESHLLQVDGVRQVLAVVIAQSRYDKYICAYYVAKTILDEQTLRRQLREHLPDYMLPKFFIHLEKMPVTKNGKVDRKALPVPDPMAGSIELEKPKTYLEKQLIKIWSNLLQIAEDKIGAGQDFFDIGGHSILAVYLVNAIRQQFQVHITLRSVFDHPTIRQLAVVIRSASKTKTVEIPKAAIQETYPASPAQQRLFYEQLLNADSLAYNISNVFEVDSTVDLVRLQEAFRLLIKKHESLRTSFILGEDGIRQRINQNVEFNITVLDPEKSGSVQQAFDAFIKPYTLEEPCLLRCAMLPTGNNNYLLFVDIHHIICDGISFNILMHEIKNIYLKKETAAPMVSYVDYTCWLQSSESDLRWQQEYWLQKLRGELKPLSLPSLGHPSPLQSHDAGSRTLEVKGLLFEKSKQLTTQSNTSEFVLLLSVYYVLLSKITGHTDIIIGTDVVGRNHASLGGVVGNFINLLPLRTTIEPHITYTALLRTVKETVVEALDNQDIQINEIIASLRNGGNSIDKLFDVHFAYVNYIDEAQTSDDFMITPVLRSFKETTQYEFKLEATRSDSGYSISFIYSKDLYSAATIDLFIQYYENILQTITDQPDIEIGNIDVDVAGIGMVGAL